MDELRCGPWVLCDLFSGDGHLSIVYNVFVLTRVGEESRTAEIVHELFMQLFLSDNTSFTISLSSWS